MTLRHHDLRDLVYHVMEIDSFKSKMGSDEDIITISFSTKTKESADDLESFLEKGYTFVLDADATSGEQSDGTYKVFVEIERKDQALSQIMELADGIKNLTGLENIRFRYYKNWRSRELSEDNLKVLVPTDPKNYGVKITESNMDNYKNFFNRSFVESVDVLDDILTIKKAWADPLKFKVVDFNEHEEIFSNLTETFDVNGWAEIIFLTKYIGDYNISKYGSKLTIENAGKVLVVERIQ